MTGSNTYWWYLTSLLQRPQGVLEVHLTIPKLIKLPLPLIINKCVLSEYVPEMTPKDNKRE